MTLEREISRLSEAVASGGQLSGLLTALQSREARRTELQASVSETQALRAALNIDRRALSERVRTKLADWQGLALRNVAQGRQILRKLLEGPIACFPIQEAERVVHVRADREPMLEA